MYNSKEFEDHLRLKNFDELEKQFQETKKIFLDLKDDILYSEIKEKFPAFGFFEQEVRIKFPTYFIRIIDNQITQSELEQLLGIDQYSISEETNVVKFPSLKPVHSLAVHCLKTSLAENLALAEKIENILQHHNITSERCVSSGHFIIPITVDDNGYIKIKK